MPKKPPSSDVLGGGGEEQGQSNRSDETTAGPEGQKHGDSGETDTGDRVRATASDHGHTPIWKAQAEQRRKGAKAGVFGAERVFSQEQRDRAKAEWLLGVKTPGQIAAEIGCSRTNLYSWADTEGWPLRGSARPKIEDEITATLITETAADLRSRARTPETAADEELAKRLADLELDVQEGAAPETRAIVQEYSLAVVEVIREHQKQAGQCVEIGENLIAMYHASVGALRKSFERLPSDKKVGILARMDLISKTAAQFSTLVRSMQVAQKMQREAYGLDREPPRAPNDPPRKGDTPPGQSPAAPGSYEEVLLEMEARSRGH